jgi:CheY-like chemotaxis protein
LRRTLPSAIEVTTLAAEGLWPVRLDPAELDQLVMNLALNASDAMPNGGHLTIELENQRLDHGSGSLTAGDYAVMRVTDTGTGIDASDLQHIFEPFFTTKSSEKGTGLGLATCYAVAQQAGGDIRVMSRIGKGTTFTVWLPRSAEEPRPLQATHDPRTLLGSETVLVAEDDPAVMSAVTHALERHGYTVLQAPNGEAALRLVKSDRFQVDLVLTDTVMPQMTGPELASHLGVSHPSLKVLFMTGYADENAMKRLAPQAEAAFLLKPFLPHELVRRVREVLDASAAPQSRRNPS